MALSVASVLTGLLAYLFFAISTRTLGAAAAAPVSVLWTYWSFSSAAFTFPLQHWVARSVAAHDGEASVHRALPRVALVVGAVSVTTGLLAWLFRDPLFHSDQAWFPLLVAAVTLGSGFVGVVRGGLAARHRFMSLSVALVAENGLRCVAAGALAGAGVTAPLGYGLCLAAGPLVGLFWPSAVRFARDQGELAEESALRFLGGASGGQLIGQAVLTGGPVVLALGGGTAAQVTSLFAALALFRAPYTVAISLVAKLTGRLTVLYVRGTRADLRRVRLVLVVGTTVALPAAAVVGALAGPALLPVIFGSDVQLDASLCAVIAVGSTFALANLVSTVMLMAQGRTWGVVRGWLVGVLAGAMVVALSSADPLTWTCWAFLVAEGVAFAALALEELRGPGAKTGGARW